jgi:hypothetical protein
MILDRAWVTKHKYKGVASTRTCGRLRLLACLPAYCACMPACYACSLASLPAFSPIRAAPWGLPTPPRSLRARGDRQHLHPLPTSAHETLATWSTCCNIVWNKWNIWNIRLQHMRIATATYATSRKNTCNIRLKQLKYLKQTLTTYVYIHCNICNTRSSFATS